MAERLPAQPSLALQRAWRVAGWVSLVLLVLLLPLILKGWKGDGFPKEMGVWVNMTIFMVVALGCNVIVGYTGLLNLGFAGFMCIGAYTAAILMKGTPWPIPGLFQGLPASEWTVGWPFGAALIAATLVGAVCGILLGFPTLRLTGDYFAIVTLGFTEIILLVVKNWTSVTGGTSGFRGVPRPEITWFENGLWGSIGATWDRVLYATPEQVAMGFSASLREIWNVETLRFGRLEPVEFWYVVGAALILTIYVMRRLELGRTGRAWVAIREDELAAQAAGINVTWFKTQAFAVSAAVAGFGGGLYAAVSGNLSFYDFNFFVSVYLVLYVVFGGMGSIVGTMLGTVVLYYLLELLRDVLTDWNQAHPDGQVDANLRYILYAVVLILIMRYRPMGLLPPRARLRERLPARDGSGARLCHLSPEGRAEA